MFKLMIMIFQRAAIFLIMACACGEATAQLRINVSLASPPFLENVEIGRSQRYDKVKDAISPGIEFDNLFPKGDEIVKLHYSVGFYYYAPSFVGVFYDTDNDNQFVSEINSQMINMPILARGSFKISDLIENNRLGMELGIVASTWIKYKLHEVAAIKERDTNGNIISERVYSDEGNLISGFGSKVNFKVVGGFFVYVNRFYLSARFDMVSLSNLYSSRLEKTWKVPADYSLYQHASGQGRMKNSYVTLIVSFRITKK
jgi:hypothetical protein